MAAYHGKQGKITFAAGTTTNLTGWTLDTTAEVADSTVMNNTAVLSSTHWRDYTPGFKAWTATVEIILDDTTWDPSIATDFGDEDGAALVLHGSLTDSAAVTRKYSGTAFITGISVTVDKDDVARCTYAFQGSSTLSVAADET